MNVPFLQTATFTGLVSTNEYYTSQEWKNAYDIATFYSQNSAILIEQTTFGELTSLKASNKLKPGQLYQIKDFKLKWLNLDASKTVMEALSTEPLIVLALSTNAISQQAYSSIYPQDIVYYDIDARTSTTWNSGQNIPDFKGWVYRRVDTDKSIDICWDWRNITNNCCRYDLSPVALYDAGTTYSKGNVVKTTANKVYISVQNSNTGNNITITTWWRPMTTFNDDSITYYPTFEVGNTNYIESIFELRPLTATRAGFPTFTNSVTVSGQWSDLSNRPRVGNIKIDGAGDLRGSKNMVFHTNITFLGGPVQINDIYIGPASSNNILLGSGGNGNSGVVNLNNCRFGGSCVGNVIAASFQNNSIGDTFQFNAFSQSVTNNIIGNTFLRNHSFNGSFISTFSNNIIGTSCQNNFFFGVATNTINTGFTNNVTLSLFTSNTIGESCTNNIIGQAFQFNRIGSRFQNNTIGTSFTNNVIDSGCTDNTFGTSFNYNVLGNLFANNTIGDNARSNRIGSEVNGNTIGTGFAFNAIENTMINNVVGDDFTDNVIRNDFIGNTIQSNFNSVTVGANTGGIDFTGATHVYNSYDKQLFINSDLVTRLSYINSSDQLVITDPTA
jgi:hypothetical protein